MKASDFARTSSQRNEASEQLVRTEQTDAVNAGLVGRADKSERSLKSNVMSNTKKAGTGAIRGAGLAAATTSRRAKRGVKSGDVSPENVSSTGERAGAETATSRHAAQKQARAARRGAGSKNASTVAGSKNAGERAAAATSDATEAQATHHLGDSLKKGRRPAAASAGAFAVAKTLENTELEGYDNAYRDTRGASRLVRGIKKRIAGRDALDAGSKEKSLGELSEKRYQAKAAQGTETATKSQAASHFKRGVYETADKAKAAKTAKGGLSVAKGTGGLRGLLAGFGAGALHLVLGVAIISAIFSLLVAAIAGQQTMDDNRVSGFGNLTGIQLEVAQALAAEDLGPAQIAAIMGNISGESGWDPTNEYHGEGNNYAYEYGYGLFQFTDTQVGVGEYSSFVAWCNANGFQKESATAQVKYFILNLNASWMTGLHRNGYYTKYITDYAGRDASYDAWLATDDVGFATYCVMACWLRPADWAANQSFYRDRLPAAQAFYEQLTSSGSGEEYAAADSTQRAIVDAAGRTPSPGAGWCALWVSQVYQNAGLGGLSGNACDMYDAWCHSTDRSQLQVGMLVAVRSSSSGTEAGRTYGHIGIYIGDGKVMHNSGIIEVSTLDDWIATYCKWSSAGWGFPPNVA